MNRFRWNALSSPTQVNPEITFAVLLGGTFFVYLLQICLAIAGSSVGILVVWIIFLVLLIIVVVRARMNFRNHYKIEGNGFTDCCTMYWCLGCSIIQMLRQTHNEDEYRYECGNCFNGLPPDAPDIV
jgi:Cys-rich protein (TIGR01571 family)